LFKNSQVFDLIVYVFRCLVNKISGIMGKSGRSKFGKTGSTYGEKAVDEMLP
jgi:hypothetical protein